MLSMALLTALLALPALADDEICEDLKGEAGSLPSTAYRAVGTGPLRVIVGTLSGASPFLEGPGQTDSEDLYLIQIIDPAAFMARTVAPLEPPLFDTSLWLFDPCAGAALGNRLKPGMPGGPFAQLLPQASDATGFVLSVPGPYYIGISGGTRQPGSEGGEMFIFAAPDEISGPDGPGADFPLSEWFGSEEEGNYRVILDGVAFLGLQPVCPADLNSDGAVDAADLGLLLSGWGACPLGAACLPDLNRSGKVDAADLGELLAAWGGCPLVGTPCGDPATGSCFEPDGSAGCSDPCCCTQVCASFPQCCAVVWDQQCVQIAIMVCPGSPAR
jgi:hypothetical protein